MARGVPSMSERIAVIGLGYVGLPVAVALARVFPGTIGFDISERRVAALREGVDHTGEIAAEELREAALTLTTNPADLAGVGFFVVTVPTPIDAQRCPDLEPLRQVWHMGPQNGAKHRMLLGNPARRMVAG